MFPTVCSVTSPMCCRSGVGAQVESTRCRAAAASRAAVGTGSAECTLAGGDDYELVFTAPTERADAVQDAARPPACR